MSWAAAVPLWATVLGAFAAFLYVRRHGGGAAIGELERANGVLERRLQELEKVNREQAHELGELRAKTDFVVALAPIMAWAEAHERNATTRHTAMLAIMEMIAERLGPDANGFAGG